MRIELVTRASLLASFWACAVCLTTSVAFAQDVIPPKSYTTTPSGINVADGSYLHTVTDLSIGPMQLVRTFRSGTKQPNDPPFGRNFSNNFDIYVAVNPKLPGTTYNLVVHLGGSASGNYVQDSGNLPQIGANNMDAEKGLLVWSGPNNFNTGKYVYTDSSGTVYTFSSTVTASGLPFSGYSRRVETIDFPDGRRQSFTYNASNHLRLVEDTSGYAILFDVNASGDVTAACAFNRSSIYVSTASTCTGATLKTSYGYTTISSSHYLTSATDVLGATTTYTNGYQGLSCLKPPGFATCQVSLAFVGGRLGTQTLADGAQWMVTGWDPAQANNPDEIPPYDGSNEVSVTDPAGTVLNLTFTKTSPYTMTDASGNVTQYRFEGAVPFNYTDPPYHDGSMLIEAILPEGNKYTAQYLGPFKAVTQETMTPKAGSGLSPQVKTYTYNNAGTVQNRAKPITINDPKGNQTNYTYASHGGVLTEMKPAPTSGAARPLVVTSWVQRYAMVLNSTGQLVQAATPVWLMATQTQCQTAAGSSTPVCDGAAMQTLTTFEYGAVGTVQSLLLKGKAVSSGGTTLRSCYGYDSFNRKISETLPNAGLGVCP